MTLVLNEFVLFNGLAKTLLVAAADRRVTKQDGTFDSNRKKLFLIPRFTGALSYFGLAGFNKAGKTVYLSDILPGLIQRESNSCPTLGDMARRLRSKLNATIPACQLQSAPSGFHICGYRNDGLPEFWFLTNTVPDADGRPAHYKSSYGEPSDDFLGRDARHSLGWDGVNHDKCQSAVWTYRNGDYRAHALCWQVLDSAFEKMFEFGDFPRPRGPSGYGKYVRFKFEVIAYFYAKWAKEKIIGRPIDLFVATGAAGELPAVHQLGK